MFSVSYVCCFAQFYTILMFLFKIAAKSVPASELDKADSRHSRHYHPYKKEKDKKEKKSRKPKWSFDMAYR